MVYVMDAQPLFTGLDMQALVRVGEQLRLRCLERSSPSCWALAHPQHHRPMYCPCCANCAA